MLVSANTLHTIRKKRSFSVPIPRRPGKFIRGMAAIMVVAKSRDTIYAAVVTIAVLDLSNSLNLEEYGGFDAPVWNLQS